MRRIVDEEMEATEQLLSDNRDKLDSLAEALLERETLDEADAYAAAGIERGAGRAAPMTRSLDRHRPRRGHRRRRPHDAPRWCPRARRRSARISQKAPGVIAGLRRGGGGVPARRSRARVRDALPAEGEWREAGAVAEIAGAAALDPHGRARGAELPRPAVRVATLTARYVRAVEGTGVQILDTRKTTPGLRALEKEAVRAGGGVSHRSGLYDAILVKENHATLAGGVGEAARLALEARAGRRDGRGRVRDARRGRGGARRGRAAHPARQHEHRTSCARRSSSSAAARSSRPPAGSRSTTCASVAETGVDFICVGALTHSAPALDVSLLLEPL